MDDPLADELRDYCTDTDLDRCEALLRAAQDHLRHRRPQRARGIWRQLIKEGGASGEDAYVDYVDYVFRHAYDDAELSALRAATAEGDSSWLTWFRVAALLEKQGRLVEALIWYSRAIDDLSADQVKVSRPAKLIATGRRRVKWALGLELDSIDLLGDAGDVEGVDNYFDFLDLFRVPQIIHGRVPVWSRAELAQAREQWPGRITAESIDAYYRGIESELRGHDERVTVVHWTFQFFLGLTDALERRLGEPSQSNVWNDPPPEETPGVHWPPGRNQQCWCGSGRKYKRCCGLGEQPPGTRQAWGPTGLRGGAQLAL